MGMVYQWNSTFRNHLRFRWYHYKFCKGRALIFSTQDYLNEWESSILDRLIKYPGEIIPSFGLKVILNKMEKEKYEKIISFLESEDVNQGIDMFIQELNSPEIFIPANQQIQKTETLSNQSGPRHKIEARAFVIALNIYYQLHNRENEYKSLIHSKAQYEETLRFIFRVKKISTHLSKVIKFNYKDELNKPKNNKGRSQLKKQLQQIINAPEIFSKEIIKRAKEIHDENFLKGR